MKPVRDESMKITFVLPPVNMSGGIRAVAIHARLLVARGHEVVLVSPPPQPKRAPLRARLRRPFSAFGAANEATPRSHLDGAGLDHRVLEAWRPVADADVPDADVVVATWWETAEWVAALSPRKGAKAYFVQGHEVYPWLAQERSRATYRLPMHKIVVARWLARTMAEAYGDHDVDVVHNSVDHRQFFAAPRGRQPVPTVGLLYSSVPLKGFDTALHALRLLRERVPVLRTVCFGSERPPAGAMAGIAYSLHPPQHALRELYAACDVWLTASRVEGFNLTAMEAMACRTPVVSTRTGWPEEAIVDGRNGALADVDDAPGLAAAAQRFLELPDPAWRQCSQAAFDTVRDSSWDRSGDLFEAALHRAVERAAAGALKAAA